LPVIQVGRTLAPEERFGERPMRSITAVLVLLTLAGCTGLWQALSGEAPRQGQSSSLVDFLYPGGEQPPPVSDEIPVLRVPLRVGLAFVPGSSLLPEATRVRLLEQARSRFVGEDFIADIVVIPENYLPRGGGFTALAQVGRVFGLDVIALVSYDQVSVADDRTGSLLYWTIVGAYVIKGSQNDVSTFVDTAVFDLATRRLLFRAPGRNELTDSATLVGSADSLREAREESFERAMAEMTTNLAAELDRFESRIKEDRSVLIAKRDGSGATGLPVLLAIAAAFLLLRQRV